MPIETLRPNAVGAAANLVPSPPPNWDCCDEAVSDGDATFVRSSNVDDLPYLDLYNIVNTGIPADAVINSVMVKATVRSLSFTWLASFRLALKKWGQFTVYGSLSTPRTAYETIGYVFTGVGRADLDPLQIGVEIASTEGPVLFYLGRCTQVWVEINYTEPGGMASKRLLVGVGL